MESFSTPALAIKKAVGNAVYHSEAFAKSVRIAFEELCDPLPEGGIAKAWEEVAQEFGFCLLEEATGSLPVGYVCVEI